MFQLLNEAQAVGTVQLDPLLCTSIPAGITTQQLVDVVVAYGETFPELTAPAVHCACDVCDACGMAVREMSATGSLAANRGAYDADETLTDGNASSAGM